MLIYCEAEWSYFCLGLTVLLKQYSVKQNSVLFHNKNAICSINHFMLALIISFPSLKNSSPPKQVFVHQNEKTFFLHTTSRSFKVYVSAHRIIRESSNCSGLGRLLEWLSSAIDPALQSLSLKHVSEHHNYMTTQTRIFLRKFIIFSSFWLQLMTFRSVSVVLVQQGASFSWDGVNCFHQNLYGPMFWICDVNSVDKTPIFYYFIPDHWQSLLCFSQ